MKRAVVMPCCYVIPSWCCWKEWKPLYTFIIDLDWHSRLEYDGQSDCSTIRFDCLVDRLRSVSSASETCCFWKVCLMIDVRFTSADEMMVKNGRIEWTKWTLDGLFQQVCIQWNTGNRYIDESTWLECIICARIRGKVVYLSFNTMRMKRRIRRNRSGSFEPILPPRTT